MTFPSPPREARGSADRRSKVDTRLHGPWLVIARLVWLAITAVYLLLFVVNFPLYLRTLQTVCRSAACPDWQPVPATVPALQHIGLSLASYTALSVTLTIISTLLWVGIGLFMFWRKSDEWIILLFSLQAVAQGINGPTGVLQPLQQSPSIWQGPVQVAFGLNLILLWLVFALFPNGRFVPRWMRWVVLIFLALIIGIGFLIPAMQNYGPLNGGFFFLTAIILLAGQIYRYRRVSTPVERQQTKLVVFSFVVVILVQIGFIIPYFIFPSLSQPGSLYPILNDTVEVLILLIAPPSIAISLLRYRLWEIDLLINRTLVYGVLTVSLALVYAGLIIGLQSLVHLLTGTISEQPLVIVASTLAIAALFQPLRHRLQAIIDRRFYRRKYDAARTVAEFSATLRNEVDLNQLREHLLAVVQETMQPAHVSLWLRKTDQEGKSRTTVE